MVRARPLPPAAGLPPFRRYQPATHWPSPVPQTNPAPRPAIELEDAVEIDDVTYEDEVETPATITPELLHALREIAPRRRRGRSLHVVVLALVTAAVLGGFARELVASKFDLFSSQVRTLLTNVDSPEDARKAAPGRP